MASGRAADREDPNNTKRKAARSLDRDPISELHQGQRSDAPHQRAGHMTAPDHVAEAQLNILRRRGPSTYEIFTLFAGWPCWNSVPCMSVKLGGLDHLLGKPFLPQPLPDLTPERIIRQCLHRQFKRPPTIVLALEQAPGEISLMPTS